MDFFLPVYYTIESEKEVDDMALVTVTALGGSGENGRNCYLLCADGRKILLDCGVSRDSAKESIGRYPALTRELACSLDAVFLSHAHEDHCAALPLLYALGYCGAVHASPETAQAAPGMIRKWRNYVCACGGVLPYSEQDAARVAFAPLQTGENTRAGLRALTGRSGHTVGSLWITFQIGENTVFYSGDVCLRSRMLSFDVPPRCDSAILDYAYAGKTVQQQAQYDALLSSIRRRTAEGGKVLLPLPASGRGCDVLLTILTETDTFPVFAEASIVRNCESLLQEAAWMREGFEPSVLKSPRLHSISTEAARQAACKQAGSAFLITDGMLTTPEALTYLNCFRDDPTAHCILTGHAASGTAAGNLRDEAWRRENGICMTAEMLTVKVHPDDADEERLLESLGAKQVVFFHAPRKDCEAAIGKLAERGIDARCLAEGQSVTVSA